MDDSIREDMIRARAERERAEAAHWLAEARLAEIQAEADAIDLAAAKRKEEQELSSNKYHCVYTFTDSVSSSSVERCIEALTTWMRTRRGSDIEIIFHSPGGSIVDGMALFDFIQRVRQSGHHVTTTALGMAASMAGVLLQAGDLRVMGRESWMLIHEASLGAVGKIGEVEDTVAWVNKVQKRILAIFAARSSLTVAQIAHRWKRKDWWLSSDECLKLGLVDEVR